MTEMKQEFQTYQTSYYLTVNNFHFYLCDKVWKIEIL